MSSIPSKTGGQWNLKLRSEVIRAIVSEDSVHARMWVRRPVFEIVSAEFRAAVSTSLIRQITCCGIWSKFHLSPTPVLPIGGLSRVAGGCYVYVCMCWGWGRRKGVSHGTPSHPPPSARCPPTCHRAAKAHNHHDAVRRQARGKRQRMGERCLARPRPGCS